MTSNRQFIGLVLWLLAFPVTVGSLGRASQPTAGWKTSAATKRIGSVVRYYEVGEDETGRLVRITGRLGKSRRPPEIERSSEHRGRVAQGESSRSWRRGRLDIVSLVRRAAGRHNIDPNLIYAVIRHESNFDPFAISHKGARGLMQLMPDTASRFGVKDIFDPAENVDGGTRFLRHLLDRYEGDRIRALAAYNAGEAAVERYGGVPPYAETLDYVDRVSRSYVTGEGSVSSKATDSDKGPRIVVRVAPSGAIRFEMEPR